MGHQMLTVATIEYAGLEHVCLRILSLGHSFVLSPPSDLRNGSVIPRPGIPRKSSRDERKYRVYLFYGRSTGRGKAGQRLVSWTFKELPEIDGGVSHFWAAVEWGYKGETRPRGLQETSVLTREPAKVRVPPTSRRRREREISKGNFEYSL